MFFREVDQQPFEEVDPYVGQVPRDLAEHLLTLFEAEERLRLLRVADHSHDDVIEVARRALDDVEMAVGYRVERARAQSSGHASMLLVVRVYAAVAAVTSVSPYERSQATCHDSGNGAGPELEERSTTTVARSASHPDWSSALSTRRNSAATVRYGGSRNTTSNGRSAGGLPVRKALTVLRCTRARSWSRVLRRLLRMT